MATIRETLYCEQCGEPAAIRLTDAGLCEDCFQQTFQEHVKGVFWCGPCGHPYFSRGRLVAVCLVPAGEEHDHSSVKGWGY